tara:strand:- start:59 stop:436 length:378 start_codon:yes stop_codon:yes gene_type:complete
MNQNLINVIGSKQKSRSNSLLSPVYEVEGLIDVLNKDFDDWSNFDGWESIGVQQWIFVRAMEVYSGKQIDIKCNCCEYIDSLKIDWKTISTQKCFGIKSLYMISKVLDEIVLAQARRDTDGTYSA